MFPTIDEQLEFEICGAMEERGQVRVMCQCPWMGEEERTRLLAILRRAFAEATGFSIHHFPGPYVGRVSRLDLERSEGQHALWSSIRKSLDARIQRQHSRVLDTRTFAELSVRVDDVDLIDANDRAPIRIVTEVIVGPHPAATILDGHLELTLQGRGDSVHRMRIDSVVVAETISSHVESALHEIESTTRATKDTIGRLRCDILYPVRSLDTVLSPVILRRMASMNIAYEFGDGTGESRAFIAAERDGDEERVPKEPLPHLVPHIRVDLSLSGAKEALSRVRSELRQSSLDLQTKLLSWVPASEFEMPANAVRKRKPHEVRAMRNEVRGRVERGVVPMTHTLEASLERKRAHRVEPVVQELIDVVELHAATFGDEAIKERGIVCEVFDTSPVETLIRPQVLHRLGKLSISLCWTFATRAGRVPTFFMGASSSTTPLMLLDTEP